MLAVGKKIGIRNAKGLVEQICDSVANFSQKTKGLKISERTVQLVQSELDARTILLCGPE